MAQSIINYYFYSPAQLIKPLNIISPMGWMVDVGNRVDFQAWTFPKQASVCILGSVCILNEILYRPSGASEDGSTRDFTFWVHELQKILTVACLIDSLIRGYRTGSWSRAIVNVTFQIPAIASCIFKGPSFPFARQIIPSYDFSNNFNRDLVDLFVANMRGSKPIFLKSSNENNVLSFLGKFLLNSRKSQKPKVYELSIATLASLQDWRAQMFAYYRHLEGEGEVILYVPSFHMSHGVCDNLGKNSLYNLLLQHKNVPRNVTVVLASPKLQPYEQELSFPLDIDASSSKKEPLPYFARKGNPMAATLAAIRSDSPVQRERQNAYEFSMEIMLASLVSKHRKHHVVLTAPHPEVHNEANESLTCLIGRTLFEGSLFFIDLAQVERLADVPTKIQSLAVRGSEIFIIQGVESLFPPLLTDAMNKPQIPPELISLLKLQMGSIILEIHPRTSDFLLSSLSFLRDRFQVIELPPLHRPLKQALFEEQREGSKLLKGNPGVWENVTSFVGPDAPLDEHLAVMRQIEGFMSFDKSITFDHALGQLKAHTAHNRKQKFLPPNLTELTATSEEVVCLERGAELERMVVILNSKSPSNNVCLIGDAGCGKTQLVRYFAQQLKAGAIPTFQGGRVFSMKLSSIMSGSTYIGEWQGKLKAILDFLEPLYLNGDHVFLFIDEIHMAVGAGKSSGNSTMDIANMLKEYLTHPNLKVIGATTTQEHHKYLAQDTAFKDRFTTVPLNPLDDESQIRALEALSAKFSHPKPPLSNACLSSLLSRGLTLRSAEGVLGQIHSYMELHPDAPEADAANWALKLLPPVGPTSIGAARANH